MISLKTVNKGVRRPINLFLAEIIIALLFFSISGAVILQVFAAADIKSRKSGELESVIICAQTLAEAYSESGNIVTAAKIVWEDPEINTTDGTNTEIYTADGKISLTATEQRKKNIGRRAVRAEYGFQLRRRGAVCLVLFGVFARWR